ncbi:MAG: phosphomannomutase [Rhizobiaceae bacterium]|nr:phosphomannomutase [Rhizobiaceae bacterium]
MVAFGTSGLRGLATDLLAGPGYAHAAAFATRLIASGQASPGDVVLVGMDRRDSSPQLSRQAVLALNRAGLKVENCGILPTPALALRSLDIAAAAIMVTGSHIPADRNGLKFYRPDGEIDKADEAAITAGALAVATAGAAGAAEEVELPAVDPRARDAYVDRYLSVFPRDLLEGLRIGIYRHSSVAADIVTDLVQALGGDAVPLGGSDGFVAIDTEAIDPGTAARLAAWTREHRLDALLSTDGDGDRPLVVDETGRMARGDALGAVSARFLKADVVVTPVSSNPGIGARLGFDVIRTRIGSPYVIEGMAYARSKGYERIVGFEANGGLLLGTEASIGTATLDALATRDSVLPMLCALAAGHEAGVGLARLFDDLALPVCLSGRIENFARADSDRLMAWLRASDANLDNFVEGLGVVSYVDETDGLQIHLRDGSMLHLRPSGNAPEMRCYASSPDEARAAGLLRSGLERISDFRNQVGGDRN